MKKLIYNPTLKCVTYENAGNNTGVDTRMILCTYEGLKFLRDNAKLDPGVSYRITDYKCTTIQQATQAADHQFDIIVQAISNDALSEHALATHHAGDDYFAKVNLAAWQLQYCLDNDTQRFVWADEANGRGVIYRMIDEFNNDCPYDFKNIMFWRDADTVGDMVDGYYYTFHAWIEATDDEDRKNYDSSMLNGIQTDEASKYSCTDNIIKVYFETAPLDGIAPKYLYGTIMYLNSIVFFNQITSIIYSDMAYYCVRNIFEAYCYNNTFGGNNYRDNTFKNGCSDNTFKNGCENNMFGNSYCNETHETKVRDYKFWETN